jgi:hypothetical protein
MNDSFLHLQNWLAERSVKNESNGTKVKFSHISGDISILLLHDVHVDAVNNIEFEPLSSFYNRYAGASIGDAHILVATSKVGGVQLSNSLRIPDLREMTMIARELEFPIGRDEQVFMVSAAWLFVYTINSNGKEGVLREYDRDFSKIRVIKDLDEVLESWWKIVLADL